MKTAYYLVTIPAGEFLVTASTPNGRHLEYFDMFDKAIIYRYFDVHETEVRRISGKEGARRLLRLVKEGGRPETFASLQRFGNFR